MLEVGRVVKPHGLSGEVVVTLVTDRTARLDPGSVLRVGQRQLTVVTSRPYRHRFLVTFEGIGDRDAADALAGAVLMAAPIDDPDALWVHDVIGTMVVTADGSRHGRVVAVVANPAHDLLELESGALVPAVFVVSSADGMTVVDPPSGLL
jgi:16S rRNA processing protein RimM